MSVPDRIAIECRGEACPRPDRPKGDDCHRAYARFGQGQARAARKCIMRQSPLHLPYARTATDEKTSHRPRVLHLISSFEIGGTERQAVALLKRLDPERFDVRLAALRLEGPFYQEISERFPDVPEFPLTSFYNANAGKQLLKLRSLLTRERIDILHAHDFYSGFIGSVAARLGGTRVIACQRHLRLSDRKVHQLGTRMIHRLAHRILVNSEAIHHHILSHDNAHAEKIVVIKNGVIPQSATICDRKEVRRMLGLGSDAKLIGMVARLQPVKGHRFFIEAARRVLDEEPEAHFVLIGDGPLKGEIESQALRLGIRERLHLLGDRTDAACLASSFDLVVLASLHEGLPNAVMEAMAAGVAVVATAVGGTMELIADKETGYLTAPGDADALARRMAFALKDENRGRIAEQGRAFVLERFGIERMVESVEHLYDELMEGRG